MKSNPNSPAFPLHVKENSHEDSYVNQGITIRDYFAAKAMQGILAKDGYYRNNGPGEVSTGLVPSEVAKMAYEFADAMIKESQK